MISNPWFIGDIKDSAKLRLICFPYAGGSANIYRSWSTMLPESIEVVALQLPGRANRFAETAFTDMAKLIPELWPQIRPLLGIPYIIFGHSMGSYIGFELIKKIQSEQASMPEHFIASACRAPHLPLRREPIHHLEKNACLQALREFGGTSESVLQNQELMELYLPMLKADFQLADTFMVEIKTKLHCHLTVFRGIRDSTVNYHEASAWFSHFTKPQGVIEFSGGHFFIDETPEVVVQEVSQIIEECMTERADRA